ncbi:uncharacterized protein LOC135196968 isoform X2 [Macrobrachium nipponense]|uniref:uncharacterized protein LOC135196968 isoform X2 n=1 Tax=Macrobrachium nipponense TaxID=159736 RepID=UPI0030C7DC47
MVSLIDNNVFSPVREDKSRRIASTNGQLPTTSGGKMAFVMNSNTSKECEICNEDFSEGNHCPKVLPCSHSICTLCVEQLIAGNKTNCPFCRKAFDANSANDLGTNIGLLKLLKYVSELEISLKATPTSIKGKRTSALLKMYKAENKEIYDESAGRCTKAVHYIKRSIRQNSSVRDSLIELTKMIRDEIYPALQEIEHRAETHIGFLGEEIDKMQMQMKAVSRQKEAIGEVEDKMQGAPSFSHIDPVLEETEEMVARTNDVMGDLKKFLIKNKETREEIQKRTKKIVDMVTAVKDVLIPDSERQEEDLEDDLDLSSEMVAMATEEDVPKHLNIRYLKQMRKPVQSSLQKGRIHAVQAQQGRKRYAQITIKGDNEFCLHHLRDEAPSYEFHTVDYDELMEEINTAAGLTFLELGIGQDYLGRLLIRLSLPSTNKAHHFYLLCTGEKGPSYANTNCLKVWNKGDDKTEFAVFGDYEENDGSGGKAIIPGVDWEEENQKDEHMMPWVEGLVGGKSTEATAAMFGIFLRDNPGSELPGCFGKVEKGLEVLTDALDKNPDVGKCRIVDCGIVFSM